MFGPIVAGVSLGAPCRMRFRRAVKDGYETRAVLLEPRSMYVLKEEARSVWQHSIPALKAVRYSVTFRQVRPSWKERNGHAPAAP
jgi:alkylated DNA repair dioxygenase AlkB